VSAFGTGAAPAVLAMTFYVDVVVCNTVKQKIVCDGVSLIAHDHYVFQDGEVYERAQMSPMGTSTGIVSNPASGIRKHVVLDIGVRNASSVENGQRPTPSSFLLEICHSFT
jgi:hypothetical protein